MKKHIPFLLHILTSSLVALMIIGCNEPSSETVPPTIEMHLVSIDHNSATFNIAPDNADWCSVLVFDSQPATDPTAEEIHSSDSRVDLPTDVVSTHIVTDLDPEHTYYIYAAAGIKLNEEASLYTTVKLDFTTSEKPATPLICQSANTLWYDGIGDDGSDNYYIGLSECSLIKIDNQWIPETEGCYLLFLDLYGSNTTDKEHPVLPEGTYTLGESKTEGTLHYKYSGVVDYNGDTQRLSAGEVTVSRNDKTYIITALITLEDGTEIYDRYEGELTFEIGTVAPKVPKIEKNVETTFVGVRAFYIKPEMSMTGQEQITLCLYDKEPGSNGQQVDGYFLTCEIIMKDVDLYNIDFPSRQYDVTLDYMPYTTPVGDVIALTDFGVIQMGTTVRYIGSTTGDTLYAAIVSGHLTINSTDGNATYTVDVDMTTAEGYTFKGSYNGAIPVIGELEPITNESPLTEDKTINLGSNPVLTAKYREYSNVFVIEAKGSGEYDSHVDGFRLEINASEDMDKTSIPCGTFLPGTEGGTFNLGSVDRTDGTIVTGTIGYIDYLYTLFISIPWHESQAFAPATDGEITITDNGDGTHKIEYELYDDAIPSHKISCSFSGIFDFE